MTIEHEWACQRLEDTGWEIVGLGPCDRETAEEDLRAWQRDVPTASYRLAYRRVNAWRTPVECSGLTPINKADLLRALADNDWHRGDEDVQIDVDAGDGHAYSLTEVSDHGNGILLIGDKPEVSDEELVTLIAETLNALPYASYDKRSEAAEVVKAIREKL